MSIIPYGATILGGGALDPSAAALIAAMTTKPDSVHTSAINTFIVGLKSAGLWGTIDYMCGWGALHDAQASRINWKNPALIGTAQNSPVFAVDSGYTFDGATSYLSLPYTPSTDAIALTGTSAQIGVYERTNVASSGMAAGARTSSGASADRLSVGPRTPAGAMAVAGVTSGVATTATTADSRGLSAAQRSGSTITGWKNGALFDTVSPTLGALPTVPLYVGAYDVANAASLLRASQIGGVYVASAWTAPQHATFYALAQACMTAIGANV